jgi:hypothetical protein
LLAFLLENSDEAWLNMTNAILGLITLACVLVLLFGVFQTVMDKVRARARSRGLFVYDDHAMMNPELGLTMADGGERIDKQDEK